MTYRQCPLRDSIDFRNFPPCYHCYLYAKYLLNSTTQKLRGIPPLFKIKFRLKGTFVEIFHITEVDLRKLTIKLQIEQLHLWLE